MGHVAARAASECTAVAASTSLSGQEGVRGSFLKAKGHMAAKATWPMERTEEFTVQVQVVSQ